jgi:hypothetical protein
MPPGVTILYEDSARERSEFGPHALVTRCVADRLDCEPWALKDRLRGHAMNGNNKVWGECQKNLHRLATPERSVVAVFDNDRVRTMAKLAPDACKLQVAARIKQGCEPSSLLRVVLLVQNTESVLVGLRDLGFLHGRDAMLTRAIDRKDMNDRDILFKDAAWRLSPEQRVRLLGEVPSLGYLVDKLVARLSPDA